MKLKIIPSDNLITRWVAKHENWVAPVVMFFLVCIFLFILVFYIVQWREYISQEKILQSEGIKTYGKITSIKVVRGKRHTDVFPTVEFIDHTSVKHRFESEYDFHCRVGDVVSVMYLPSRPEFAIIESAGTDDFSVMSLLAIIGTLLLALFLFLYCVLRVSNCGTVSQSYDCGCY